MADGGHSFGKKTFHKPTYCHHCSDLLWGLIGQGYICEVCNFIVHERCVSNVVTPCTGIAPCIIKNPVAHCWSEPTHHKRRFCTVCRKRLDETPAVHCMICEYYAHVECQDFAVPDCKENATYVPGKELTSVKHTHHWREGNLPQTSKCAYCKKTCWSSECLTGYRCEWCGMTTHGGCRTFISNECTFGVLQPIYLPPHAVSIPRTEVPMEAIIGVQIKSKSTPLQRDYSCPELRTIGLCDATDSELSIRHLADISAQQEDHPCLLFLSPSYPHQHQLQHHRRCRKDSSCESFVLACQQSTEGEDGDADEQDATHSHSSYTNSAVDQDIDDTDEDDAIDCAPQSEHKQQSQHHHHATDISDNNNLTSNNHNHRRPPRRHEHGYMASTTTTTTATTAGAPTAPHRSRHGTTNASVTVTQGDDGLVRVVYRKQQPKKYHSALNRIRNESVMRSRSFQEQGVKPLLRHSRFFVNRHSHQPQQQQQQQRRPLDTIASDLHLDTVSQIIEITVQDEHGVPIGPSSRGGSFQADVTTVQHGGSYDSGSQEHLRGGGGGGCSGGVGAAGGGSQLLKRMYRRMVHMTMGWRRSKCNKTRRARSISEEFSSGDQGRLRDEEYSSTKPECSTSSHRSEPHKAEGGGGSGSGSGKDPKRDKEKEERDEETIKVFDGNYSLRRRIFRPVTVPRTCSVEQLLSASLRSLHISREPSKFYVTDLYAPGGDEVRCQDPMPVMHLHRIEGKRPAIYLRFRDRENDKGFVRVYPGKLQLQINEPFVNVAVDNDSNVTDLVRKALNQFGLHDNPVEDYRCSEVMLDRGVTERILSWNERPWEIMKQLGKDSIRQMELMRFYLQHKQDPHGPNIALFIGNLPQALSQRNYETIITKHITEENKYSSIGPIYYEYGSVVITFENAAKAVRAFYNLRESVVEDKKLQVLLLPNIEPSMVPAGVQPLLVFVNVKSGGCQGLELISSFRKLLNPYQVFDLDNGGPLPGLYVFRHIQDYKILVCGGDGTIGWVLQCLDNVGQDSECSSPPCAIVPLGTGNDLARVLRWGPGYTGGEDPLNLLRDVIDAEEIRLDRWTVVFHPEDKPDDAGQKAAPNATVTGATQSEDNSQMLVMNNYFGIGIDADLCLDFHNAREENPNKFNSRLHNKGVYVKMGLRKMVGRKTVKELHKELRLEVDGKVVDLPPVEGIIILNILSWGSGANPWGPDKEDQFSTPNHWDGMLEVVGVSGVVHLGQIQSGLRQAVRIAQGGHIKIHSHSDIPVQVDGEPWIQPPGDVVVFNSALKATMLKKIKSRRRMTEPHIAPAVLSAMLVPASTSAASSSSSSTATHGGSGGGGGGVSSVGGGPQSENGDRDKDTAGT